MEQTSENGAGSGARRKPLRFVGAPDRRLDYGGLWEMTVLEFPAWNWVCISHRGIEGYAEGLLGHSVCIRGRQFLPFARCSAEGGFGFELKVLF